MSYRIVFHNTRSLHAHIEDVISDINCTSGDVICLTETRLKYTDDKYQDKIEGFHIIRNDQSSTGHIRPPHGIAVYVKSACTLLESLHFSESELDIQLLLFNVLKMA